MFALVLHVYETWFLTLREGLRKIGLLILNGDPQTNISANIGRKWGVKKANIEEIHSLYRSLI